MSRIYFHVKEGDAFELRGSERAYAVVMSDDIALGVARTLGLTGSFSWAHLVVPGIDKRDYDDKINLRVRAHHDLRVRVSQTETEEAWILNLNTSLLVGNDAIKLLARLHAQCEVHCFVREPNRNWLAEIIEYGVQRKTLREPFTALAAWLRTGPPGDVVCSYSVTDQFPRYDVETDARGNWDEQFKQLDATLELSPITWDDYFFGHDDVCHSWFSVERFARELAE